MNKVFCFGELLLRLSPAAGGQWIRDAVMPVYLGGAELNVATALANWELPVKYGTALPGNNLSGEIVAALVQKNIDTSAIHFCGSRVGIYYLPQGTDLKNAGVIYDRANSSFAELKTGMIDWDKALDSCSWFHFSAISPALNENNAAVCKEALEIAVKKNLVISVDLNYRSKLWKYGKQPKEVMPELVKDCQVVMGNIWSAAELLGTTLDANIHDKKSKEAYLDHATATAKAIMRSFPNCKTVANTFRFDKDSGIRYYAALNNDNGRFVSPEFNTEAVVNKIGSGDCFMAGLIYGLHNQDSPQQIIDYAAAAAFGKLQEPGDATEQTVQSVKNILNQQWTEARS